MNNRISVSSNIHFGKPCIVGTRIPVQSILELVREGISFSHIQKDYYPDIDIKDIQACIQYAIVKPDRFSKPVRFRFRND